MRRTRCAVLTRSRAHPQYLAGSTGADLLTASLLSVVRQQRHLGVRTIISTQEPVVIPPALLDLTTFAMIQCAG